MGKKKRGQQLFWPGAWADLGFGIEVKRKKKGVGSHSFMA
jgi:hypothetical protein